MCPACLTAVAVVAVKAVSAGGLTTLIATKARAAASVPNTKEESR